MSLQKGELRIEPNERRGQWPILETHILSHSLHPEATGRTGHISGSSTNRGGSLEDFLGERSSITGVSKLGWWPILDPIHLHVVFGSFALEGESVQCIQRQILSVLQRSQHSLFTLCYCVMNDHYMLLPPQTVENMGL